MFRQVSFIWSDAQRLDVKRASELIGGGTVFVCSWRKCSGTSDTFEIFMSRQDGKSMTPKGIAVCAQIWSNTFHGSI